MKNNIVVIEIDGIWQKITVLEVNFKLWVGFWWDLDFSFRPTPSQAPACGGNFQ